MKGRFRIVEMELWDEDAIDLAGPAFIELRDDDQGSFRFIAVEGWMDVREVERDGRPRSSGNLTLLSNFWTSMGACRTS